MICVVTSLYLGFKTVTRQSRTVFAEIRDKKKVHGMSEDRQRVDQQVNEQAVA
jgi:hypothetical protein